MNSATKFDTFKQSLASMNKNSPSGSAVRTSQAALGGGFSTSQTKNIYESNAAHFA